MVNQEGGRILWISASEASRRAAIRKEKLLELLNSGQIAAVKTEGGRWQIPVLAFETWLTNREFDLNQRAAEEARTRRVGAVSPGIERGK
jgi:excisionase family DNA binding protein